MFGAHAWMLFDAAPFGPMHRRSGGAGTACLGRTPSVGTRVLSSVSAFEGCSFALRVQQVDSRSGAPRPRRDTSYNDSGNTGREKLPVRSSGDAGLIRRGLSFYIRLDSASCQSRRYPHSHSAIHTRGRPHAHCSALLNVTGATIASRCARHVMPRASAPVPDRIARVEHQHGSAGLTDKRSVSVACTILTNMGHARAA